MIVSDYASESVWDLPAHMCFLCTQVDSRSGGWVLPPVANVQVLAKLEPGVQSTPQGGF